MPDFVLVGIDSKLNPKYQINYNSDSFSVEKRNISSWSEITTGNNRQLIFTLPAQLVYHTRVKIPSKNEEIIRQSLPNLIEEELANDIELNHYAYLQSSDEYHEVAVVSNSIVTEIYNKIVEYGFKNPKLYSEIYLCPCHEDCTVCNFEDYFIINFDHKGTKINKDQKTLNNYLQLIGAGKTIVYTEKELPGIEFENPEIRKVDIAKLTLKTITSKEYINLFQGKYSIDSQKHKQKSPIKKLLVLCGLLIISWLTINVISLNSLSNKAEEVQFKQRELLSDLIPDITPAELNNPYAGMLSRLKISENSNSNNSGDTFIKSLSYLGKALQGNKEIYVLSLRLREDKLEVKIQSQDISSLNAFQSNLEKSSFDMRVKTGTRDSNKDGILSVITMERL